MQIAHKKDIPTELTVEIEKLSNLGYGIARINGYVIFVENACPKDKLKVKLIKKNKNYANAIILDIIEPSPHRVQPFCPMQKVCGACQLQFIEYNYQLALKKQIVEDCFYNMGIQVKEVVPSPKTQEYRRKIQYPIAQTKESKRILAGYYKPSTHELVNIKYCPIQPKECDYIIDFIRNTAQEMNISGYFEKNHCGELRHVVIRSSEYNGKNLVILVVNSNTVSEKVKKFAKEIYDAFEYVSGVGVNFNPNKTNLILGGKTLILEGEECIEEKLCERIFNVGAETFFQVNPSSANNLFKYVKKYIQDNFKNPIILDAYAGISAFGISLSDIAQQVVCVEEVNKSVELAKKIINANGIQNIELHNMDAGTFFEMKLSEKEKQFDVTVLDPPRKGCTKESLDYALKLTKGKIVYVSCNPSTLARDLKYLIEQGCKIDSVQPFDMFPHTYHIENVAIVSV